MNEDKYFVIVNIDGDTYIDNIPKEELETRLNEGYYGDGSCFEKIDNSNTNYWKNNILIIKGEIVVPKEEEVVIKKMVIP